MSFTILSEGVLLITPRFEKARSKPFDHFLIQLPFVATLIVTLLGGSIFQRTDSLALQPEAHIPETPRTGVGASRTLGITDLGSRTGREDGGCREPCFVEKRKEIIAYTLHNDNIPTLVHLLPSIYSPFCPHSTPTPNPSPPLLPLPSSLHSSDTL